VNLQQARNLLGPKLPGDPEDPVTQWLVGYWLPWFIRKKGKAWVRDHAGIMAATWIWILEFL
jgi:hypothetical protein